MSSRPAPRPTQSPVHWVSGANVFYLRLLSVPAQASHEGDLLPFLIEKAETLGWRKCKWVIQRCCFSHTRYMASNGMGEKDFEYRVGHDTLQNRFSDTQIIKIICLTVGNSS
jgi:FMN phosphatase YigB (HAD superfamily)